jgi:hypothetical protein
LFVTDSVRGGYVNIHPCLCDWAGFDKETRKIVLKPTSKPPKTIGRKMNSHGFRELFTLNGRFDCAVAGDLAVVANDAIQMPVGRNLAG